METEDEVLDKLATIITGDSVVKLAAAKKVKIFMKAVATGDTKLIGLMKELRKLRMV